MQSKKLKELVHELIKLPAETEWVEFKENNEKPDNIGEYISALSNAAALANKAKGYLVWGVTDDTHEIKGTNFTPAIAKKGNEDLESWLVGLSNPRLYFQFHEIEMEEGKVVILSIPRAVSKPTSFSGEEYIRIGSYKKKLREFPDKERELWRTFDSTPFESLVAMDNLTEEDVTRYLDCPAYFTIQKLPLPSDRKGMVDKMVDEGFIKLMDNARYEITNLGAVLFAKDLTEFSHLKRRSVRVILYKGNGRTNGIREEEFKKGYALCFDSICNYIDGLIPQNEEISKGTRQIHMMFPSKSIREMVGNIMIHQDLTVRGAGPMVEIFDTRIEASNPGKLLVNIDRIIDTAPHSRNEDLASFLRIIHVCEERGSGFDRMEEGMQDLKIPAPKVETADDFTRTKLYYYPLLTKWTKEDKIRTCYLHTCLKYVNEEEVSNSTMRERFGLDDKNMASASRIIKETLEVGLIKLADGTAAPKMRRYIPYWA